MFFIYRCRKMAVERILAVFDRRTKGEKSGFDSDVGIPGDPFDNNIILSYIWVKAFFQKGEAPFFPKPHNGNGKPRPWEYLSVVHNNFN